MWGPCVILYLFLLPPPSLFLLAFLIFLSPSAFCKLHQRWSSGSGDGWRVEWWRRFGRRRQRRQHALKGRSGGDRREGWRSSGSGGTGARTGAAAERRSSTGFAPSDVTYKSCGHGILDGKVNGCIHRHHRHVHPCLFPFSSSRHPRYPPPPLRASSRRRPAQERPMPPTSPHPSPLVTGCLTKSRPEPITPPHLFAAWTNSLALLPSPETGCLAKSCPRARPGAAFKRRRAMKPRQRWRRSGALYSHRHRRHLLYCFSWEKIERKMRADKWAPCFLYFLLIT